MLFPSPEWQFARDLASVFCLSFQALKNNFGKEMGTSKTTLLRNFTGFVVNRLWSGDEAVYKIFIALLFIFTVVIQSTSAQTSSGDDIVIRKEPGVCQSKDIRNSVDMFYQLRGCRVVEGFVRIVLIDRANETDYANVSFPELQEITGYLLLYRVHGLRSIGKIFPNLTVIRGHTLFLNYALVVFELLHLQEIELTSLTDILRGAVYIVKNPVLCFVDTIDWDLIAQKGKGEQYIMGNKLQNECPKCPLQNLTCPKSPTTGHMLCWNTHHCQKVCPSECRGSCNLGGTCCHPNCLGGCDGPNSDNCYSCKNFLFENKCVSQCPHNTFEYLDRRCLLESDCYDMPKPNENTEFDVRNNPYKPFQNKCIMQCPSGHREVNIEGDKKRYQCVPCEGICKKECAAASVDSIAAAQKLRGCTSIKGALEIQIRGGSHVVKELEENLNMIEEIDDYLKVVRSFPLVSLNFLKNLKVIHGYKLESSKYALVVLDNQNLMELWDWGNRGTTSFKIERGRLFFHFNPKLCLSKLDKLKEVAGLGNYSDLEVASSSNGDKVACNVSELEVHVYKRMHYGALIKWKQFAHHDSRTLLGYVVYITEAPGRNVTVYDGRDACGGDGWRVDDVPVESPKLDPWINHIVTKLKPYTQYAFYVKTYTIAMENSGAQSAILYFRTEPYTPSEPRALTAYPNVTNSELVISWSPPLYPHGNVTHYVVTGQLEKDSEEFIGQRDYCLEPVLLPDLIVKPKTQDMQKQSTDPLVVDQCSCKQRVMDNKQREKEIHFEDHLQNLVYVKRDRAKRDLTVRKGSYVEDEILDSNNRYEKFSKVVNATTFIISKLKHFALYNVAVRACRDWEKDEDMNNDSKNCSSEAIFTVRTLPLAGADNIDAQYPKWEVSNKTAGEVTLEWREPSNPNGLILNYHIEYRRTDIRNFKPIVECITRKSFVSSRNAYTIKNLGPGNYSLRVKATSLSGSGEYTPAKYFSIMEDSTPSVVNALLVAFAVIILVLLAIVFLYRRQHKHDTRTKLIASVNPEYVPTVIYEPDDWEVARSKIELLKEIGQGSFGMVYEGILTNSEGDLLPCAVKTVNVQAADRDRIDFLNEASVMKAFNTHHVVKLLGVVSQGQPTLVIMELMGRGDLKSFLRSHRPDNTENPYPQPPSLERVLRMAAEIADGMAYLAAKKFVHRDLAARNCMVTDDMIVKIGDFGMTRDIYETEYYRKGSKGLLPVRWMAPESLKDGVFTSYSDAWSYGVVLYEMSTLASQPYQGLSNEQVLRYVIDGGIMERPENCPNKLYFIMKLCWKQKPTSRPSFLDLVKILQDDVSPDFHSVSFYHSKEGADLRMSLNADDTTPLRVSRDIEDFSLSDDDDYKEQHSSSSSKISNGSANTNVYVPEPAVKTTKC